MLVGSRFVGDDNTPLMNIQSAMYGRSVSHLFTVARDQYLKAERLLDVRTELGRILEPMDGFDHRTLQDSHDIIAAQFRFVSPFRPLFPTEFEPPELREMWRKWFIAEVDRLLQYPKFTRTILIAAANANTDVGYAAEKALRRSLQWQYPEMCDKALPGLLEREFGAGS